VETIAANIDWDSLAANTIFIAFYGNHNAALLPQG
jgi:hypothetical protein